MQCTRAKEKKKSTQAFNMMLKVVKKMVRLRSRCFYGCFWPVLMLYDVKNKKNASLVFGMESESCRPRKMLKFLPIFL